jgi:hypothetical protein
MKKQDILNDLEGKDFCKKILGVVEVQLHENDLQTENNIKWYQIAYLEAIDNIANMRKINMYVCNEGTEKEEAFYGNSEPVQTIKTEVKE